MSFLVDTNVLSELGKRDRCHPGVRRWFAERDDGELFLSVLTLGEIRRGIELLRRRDAGGARSLDRWLRDLERNHSAHILSVDRETVDVWGRLSPQRPLAAVDGLLAATAVHHGLTLVTRNVRDFRCEGLEVLDPFAA